MIKHHPSDELLLDYACGAQSEAQALAIATHLHYCRLCRDRVKTLEAVGGAMVEDLEPVTMQPGALDTVMARINSNILVDPPPRFDGTTDPQTAAIVPFPLRRYVGGSLNGLRWKRLGRHLQEARLPLPDPGYRISLLNITGNVRVPEHGHKGTEMTVVLRGGYHDDGMAFAPGDVQIKDDSEPPHAPAADPEGCLVLVVLDGPIQISGLVGRIVSPLMRL